MAQRIKNIIFDMGNVLIEWNPKKFIGLSESDSERQKKLYHAVFDTGIWEQQDTGELTIAEAEDAVKERLDESYYPAIESLFFRWFHQATVNTALQDYAVKLSQRGYQIFILSNTSSVYYDIVDFGGLPVSEVLTGKILSYEERLMKPDVRIFQLMCERYDLNPAECIYIDDLQANVDAAIQLGMQGLQCKDFQQAVEDRLASFVELGEMVAASGCW